MESDVIMLQVSFQYAVKFEHWYWRVSLVF